MQNFPTASQAREQMTSVINERFTAELQEIKKSIEVAIRNGKSYISGRILSGEMIAHLKKLGYEVNSSDNGRDTFYNVSW